MVKFEVIQQQSHTAVKTLLFHCTPNSTRGDNEPGASECGEIGFSVGIGMDSLNSFEISIVPKVSMETDGCLSWADVVDFSWSAVLRGPLSTF